MDQPRPTRMPGPSLLQTYIQRRAQAELFQFVRTNSQQTTRSFLFARIPYTFAARAAHLGEE